MKFHFLYNIYLSLKRGQYPFEKFLKNYGKSFNLYFIRNINLCNITRFEKYETDDIFKNSMQVGWHEADNIACFSYF